MFNLPKSTVIQAIVQANVNKIYKAQKVGK
jgi:hypothetical protein